MQKISYILIFLICSTSIWSQSDVQQFDRERWNELKGKLKYKRNSDDGMTDSGQDAADSWYEPGQEGRNVGEKDYREGSGSGSARSSSKRPDSDTSDSFGGEGLGPIAQVILILFAVAILMFILFRIFFKNHDPDYENIEIEEETEEYDINTIQKSELELALEQALAEKDYRKCIRIYFAFVLKELSKNRLIFWERDKTNYEYLYELRDKKEFSGFRNTMEIFEITWYGKRNIDEAIYKKLEPEFKNYLNQITKE